MQYIQLNPIWKNRCVCSRVVSRSNTPVLLSANKHKLIWLLTVLHKNNIYILMMKIALARQEEEFLLRMSQFLFRCVYVNGVCAHFCTHSATGISSTSAKAQFPSKQRENKQFVFPCCCCCFLIKTVLVECNFFCKSVFCEEQLYSGSRTVFVTQKFKINNGVPCLQEINQLQ